MKFVDNKMFFDYVEETGLSYSEISEKTMISRNTLYNILWNRNYPSYSVLTTLADFLEFTQEEFIAIFFSKVKFKDDVVR